MISFSVGLPRFQEPQEDGGLAPVEGTFVLGRVLLRVAPLAEGTSSDATPRRPCGFGRSRGLGFGKFLLILYSCSRVPGYRLLW